MAEVVVLGAGVAGHTAALHLKRMLPKGDTVTVVSPKSDWNWIPSNIWVGVGKMAPEKVVFPLAPIYRRKGINFVQGKAVSVYVEGRAEDQRPFVEVELTQGAVGSKVNVHYDFLVNATGPQLRFDATEGHAGRSSARIG
jgi:sulfide:quinone oxidoreductase